MIVKLAALRVRQTGKCCFNHGLKKGFSEQITAYGNSPSEQRNYGVKTWLHQRRSQEGLCQASQAISPWSQSWRCGKVHSDRQVGLPHAEPMIFSALSWKEKNTMKPSGRVFMPSSSRLLREIEEMTILSHSLTINKREQTFLMKCSLTSRPTSGQNMNIVLFDYFRDQREGHFEGTRGRTLWCCPGSKIQASLYQESTLPWLPWF